VHPWYALWLAALLPFAARPLAYGAGTFLALLPVTYVSAWNVTRGGGWSEPPWVRALVWGVPLAVLVIAALRSRRSRA
jgi:hypothetical protein